MTQTIYLVMLDTSQTRVIFTTAEHNPTDDMEVCVYDRMDELNLNQNNCDWMQITDNQTIEMDYPLNTSGIKTLTNS